MVIATTPAGTVKDWSPPVKLNVVEPVDTLIVKVWGSLVPPGVVTVTVRGPKAAAGPIAKLAVSDVVLPTSTLMTVTPPPPTTTAVAPTTKLVPVSVTTKKSPGLL